MLCAPLSQAPIDPQFFPTSRSTISLSPNNTAAVANNNPVFTTTACFVQPSPTGINQHPFFFPQEIAVASPSAIPRSTAMQPTHQRNLHDDSFNHFDHGAVANTHNNHNSYHPSFSRHQSHSTHSSCQTALNHLSHVSSSPSPHSFNHHNTHTIYEEPYNNNHYHNTYTNDSSAAASLLGPGPPIVTNEQIKGPRGANLFIFHLPNEMSNWDLFLLFRRYGTIISVHTMVDKITGLSRGYGFISYASAYEANTAKINMNGFKLGKKRLKVQHKRESFGDDNDGEFGNNGFHSNGNEDGGEYASPFGGMNNHHHPTTITTVPLLSRNNNNENKFLSSSPSASNSSRCVHGDGSIENSYDQLNDDGEEDDFGRNDEENDAYYSKLSPVLNNGKKYSSDVRKIDLVHDKQKGGDELSCGDNAAVVVDPNNHPCVCKYCHHKMMKVLPTFGNVDTAIDSTNISPTSSTD